MLCLLPCIFKFLFILQFDVAVASVFFTNSTSQKYIFGERTDCECVASHGSK